VVDLSLDLLNLRTVDEIPVASRVAVPALVRDSWHIREDAVDGFGWGSREIEIAGRG
jgi:hypothetical protein